MASSVRTAGLALAALAVGTAPVTAADPPAKFWVFVGTYTGDKAGNGIYRYEFDAATGKLTGGEVAAETRNPSFLAVHPTNRFLYAVGEIGDFGGKNQGAVNAFSLDAKTGALTPLNQQASGSSGPCHL